MTRWDVIVEICRCLGSAFDRGTATVSPHVPLSRLIEASSYHCVTPLLAWVLRHDASLDVATRDYLDAVLVLNRMRNETLITSISRLGVILNRIDVEPIVFKGGGLLVGSTYATPDLRFMGDVDVLVPPQRAGDVVRELRRAGYRSEGAPRPNSALAQISLGNFIEAETEARFDLHPAIAAQRWRDITEPDGFAGRCRSIVNQGARLRVPQPIDQLAHAVVHSQLKDGHFAEATLRIRQLVDLAAICDRYPTEIDWAELEDRFLRAGHGVVLSTNMLVMQQLLNRRGPALATPPRADAIAGLRTTTNSALRRRRSAVAFWWSQICLQIRNDPATLLKIFSARHLQVQLRIAYDAMRRPTW